MHSLDDWLEVTPYSPPLPEGCLHHVQLVFRAIDRPWVLLAREALQYAGFLVQLDQVSQRADAPWSTCLDRGLLDCAAGVLVLAERDRESAFARAEHEALLRSRSDHGKQYVTLLVDGKEPLPSFEPLPSVSFQGYRECPHGGGMLSLAWALIDEPMPSSALDLAREIDAELQRNLSEVLALQRKGTAPELLALARSSSTAWASFPWVRCRIVEALLERGALEEAHEVLELVRTHNPLSVRSRQLEVFLKLRRGEVEDALQTLSLLEAEGPDDAETQKLIGRAFRERSSQSLSSEHLRRSRRSFAQACLVCPEDHDAAARCAAASILLGEIEVARTFARMILALHEPEDLASDPAACASCAVAELALGRLDRATELYGRALQERAFFPDSHRSTCHEARQMLEVLRPEPAARDRLLAVLDAASVP